MHPKLEKLLIQHNEWGSKDSVDKLANALTDHPAIKYLDISAMEIRDDAIALLFSQVANRRIALNTLQCRKNEITFKGMNDLFRKLHYNQHLKVLNFSDNFILNELALEMELYAQSNIFIEEIILSRNKLVHSSHID